MRLQPVSSCATIVCSALLLSACGARTGLEVSSSSDAGAAGCPDLPAPPSCADAANPWLLFDYGSGGDGFEIYAVRADGTQFHQLALPQPFTFLPAATPDGTRILYVSLTSVAEPFVLHLYTLATGVDLPIASAMNLGYAAMSPDGKTIAYAADNDIRLVDADGSNDRLLSHSGYTRPVFRCDARTVFVTADGAILASLDLAGDVTTLIAGYGGYPDFGLSPDGSTVVTATTCAANGLDRALRTYPFDALPLSCSDGNVITTQGLPLGALQSALPTWGSSGLIAAVAGADTFVVPSAGGTARAIPPGCRRAPRCRSSGATTSSPRAARCTPREGASLRGPT
jgi:hypothetical protein